MCATKTKPTTWSYKQCKWHCNIPIPKWQNIKNKRTKFEKRFNVAYIYIYIYIVNDQSDALA